MPFATSTFGGGIFGDGVGFGRAEPSSYSGVACCQLAPGRVEVGEFEDNFAAYRGEAEPDFEDVALGSDSSPTSTERGRSAFAAGGSQSYRRCRRRKRRRR